MHSFESKACLVFSFVIHLFTLTQHISGNELQDYSDKVANAFKEKLFKYTKKVTQYHKIQEEFTNSTNELIFNKTNGKELNDMFVNKLQKLFDRKYKVLEKIKDRANKSKVNHKNDPKIPKFNYHNMRDIRDGKGNATVEIDESFSSTVPINRNFSFVQVPTNIYSESNAVLNTADWTKELDEVFKENSEDPQNKDLLYQYYGDSSGLYRVYPGNLNGERGKNDVDLFDCRRRIWYIQASASPKDLVIVIDISGSMIGANIGIAKISAAALIDSLQENDYFNVITVNNSVKYLIPDVKYLIQATKENKEAMKAELQKIDKPEEVVDIEKGMREAFDILLESTEMYNRTSNAGCNKAIIFITDGVEGDYAGKSVFEERNSQKDVRAFAFLVGRVKNPHNKALIEMACQNNGYFYTIETLGNIWDNVLKYLQVLSRPIASSNKQNVSYTPVYKDSTGLGMIMSVSLGVFGKEDLAGVAGTDIRLSDLDELVPYSELGVFSHGFMINNNGFISVHPKFRPQTGYLPDPPNVYLDDVEYSIDPNDTAMLKKYMIDRRTMSMSYNVYWLYDHNRKVFKTNINYYFQPVNKTDFSAAIGITGVDEDFFEVKETLANKWIERGIDALHIPVIINKTENYTQTEWTYVNISLWDFCSFKPNGQDDKPSSYLKYPNAEQLYEYLKERNIREVTDIINNTPCNKSLLLKLLTTAGIVNNILNKTWNNASFAEEMENHDKHIEALYVATSGGYMKYFTHTNESLPPLDRCVYRANFYELATVFPNASITVSTPVMTSKYVNSEPKYIQVSGSVHVANGEKKVLAAVSGMKVNGALLNDYLSNASESAIIDKDKPGISCDNNETYLCLILDHAGFIVASNINDEATGQFIGKYLPALTDCLAKVNYSVFEKVELDDTQAECAVYDEDDSAGNILTSPFHVLLNVISLFFGGIYSTLAYFTMFLLSLMDALTANEQLPTDDDLKSKINISCTKIMPYYIFRNENWQAFYKKSNNDPFGMNDLKECMGCEQKFHITPIVNTNLIFLIAHNKEECKKYQAVSLEHTKKEGEMFYNKKEKYRKRPFNCFNSTDDRSNKCGASFTEKASSVTIILSFVTLSMIRY